ncbi:MAG: universal stress protein [Owenweeksia sp.]|nr:universal stress protein [Owenweeksia sp.]
MKQIGHAKGELNKWEKRAEDVGLQVRTFLIFDVGRDEIIKHVSSYDHDFIVMGSRGATGARETFIGSNTQKIIRHAAAPVLVIKDEQPQFPIKEIVFASGFEEDVQDQFNQLVEFADLIEANIHLLYINTMYNFEETDKSEEKMQRFLKHCPRGGTCSINIFNALNEERGILEFTQRTSADLIAITTHGKTGFLQLIFEKYF